MINRFLQCLSVALIFTVSPVGNPAFAQSHGVTAQPTVSRLPPSRSLEASVQTAKGLLKYQVTVGAIPVKASDGSTIGEVVMTSYRLLGNQANRPITFAFNGGPGISSVFLNLGMMGPKVLPFANEGTAPSGPVGLRDNPATWLSFTDLVFIDPIGTGFSRTSLPPAEAKPAFFTADADVRYLSTAIYDWLTQNDRMASRKYLVGESYGGYRAPRIAHILQTQLGVGVSGLFMLSPYLDRPALGHDTQLSPLPWMIALVGMAADHLERQGIIPNDQNMAPIEAYARGEFVTDYLSGARDKAATDRLSQKVAELTGLAPAFVRQLNGRVDRESYLREIKRSEKKVSSLGDPAFFIFDSFPERARQEDNDPVIDSVLAPMTSAMVDLLVHQLDWRADGHYEVNNLKVNEAWDWDNTDGSVQDLRRAMAVDQKMTVTIAHGWSDLLCGYLGSRLIVDQLPEFGSADRIKLLAYPGGHMFYSRAAGTAAFAKEAAAIYASASERPETSIGGSR